MQPQRAEYTSEKCAILLKRLQPGIEKVFLRILIIGKYFLNMHRIVVSRCFAVF